MKIDFIVLINTYVLLYDYELGNCYYGVENKVSWESHKNF